MMSVYYLVILPLKWKEEKKNAERLEHISAVEERGKGEQIATSAAFA
jgi:hypothetical protein